MGERVVRPAWPETAVALHAGVWKALLHRGAIAGVFAWLGSPSRSLLTTADDGELPPVLQQTNRHGMPTPILLVPGAGVTVMSFICFVIKDCSVLFFLLWAVPVSPVWLPCFLI